MAGSDAAIVKGFYEDVARRDMDAMFARVHPEIEWNAPGVLPYGGRYVGHEGVGTYLQRAIEHLEEDFRVEPEEVLEAGDRVIVLGRLRGRAKVTGRDIDVPFVHLWRIRDGKLAAMTYHIDTATILQALEGAEVTA